MTDTDDDQTEETLTGGRRDPVRFSPEICDEICLRMENGESLSKICRDEHMPAKGTVAKWAKAYEEFGKQYARAREDLLLHWADQIVDIADMTEADQAKVALAKLQIESRKWTLAKLMPKVFGDRVQVDGNLNVTTHEDQLRRLEELERAAAGLPETTEVDGGRIH